MKFFHFLVKDIKKLIYDIFIINYIKSRNQSRRLKWGWFPFKVFVLQKNSLIKLFGVGHILRFKNLSELCFVHKSLSENDFLDGNTCSEWLFCYCRRLLIADIRFKSCCNTDTRMKKLVTAFTVSGNAGNAVVDKSTYRLSKSLNTLK